MDENTAPVEESLLEGEVKQEEVKQEEVKQGEISQIILPSLRDRKPQIINISERLELYNILNPFLTSTLNLCQCYTNTITASDDSTQQSCPFFRIEKQIGSDSVAGIVYLAKINRINTALKIMPIIDNKSDENNKNEIKIANLVSNLVVQNKSINFPIVYNSYYCNDITYPINSKFLPNSFKYAIDKELFSLFKKKIADQNLKVPPVKQRLFKNNNERRDIFYQKDNNKSIEKYINDTVLWFNTNYKEYELPDDNEITMEMIKPTLEGNILISELAQMDLKQFIEENLESGTVISDIVWFNIFEQVLNGINDMQKINIIHKDLHLGNVLLLTKNLDEFTCLIHDFGMSEINDNMNKDNRSFDILKFIDTILNYKFGNEMSSTKTMSKEFETFIRIFLSYITENESPEPIFIENIINFFISEKIKFFSHSYGGNSYGRNSYGGNSYGRRSYLKKTKRSKRSKRNKRSKRSKRIKRSKRKYI